MLELKYCAGNVLSENIHEIGIIALGSHLENHGSCLPIDTDAKIATYVAFKSSIKSGAKFLGVNYSAGEFDYINHGHHNSYEELLNDLENILKLAKDRLKVNKVIIVNAHGGNNPIEKELKSIEKSLNIKIIFNNKIIETEGPHAGDGELSMGKYIGICDENKFEDHSNLKKHGEIGLAMFKKARELHEDIDEGAIKIEKEGLKIDSEYGKNLLDDAVDSVIDDIEYLLSLNTSD